MAKIKRDQELYRRIRESGVRKRVARQLARLPGLDSNGEDIPKESRDALDRLDSVTSELRRHVGAGKTKAAAPKPGRTQTRQAGSKRIVATAKPAEQPKE